MELYTHQNAENSEERRDDAIRTIQAGAGIIGDILKSTLGPKGALKILQGKETAVTNDGAYILKNLLIDSASARIIANSSISQDIDEGDGTTSIAVLTSLLLSGAYKSTVHPVKILRGFSMAANKCTEILNKKKFAPKPDDIKNLVRTTLNSKVLVNSLDLFVDICIRAIESSEDIDLIEIVKLEGDLSESILVDGLLLDVNLNMDMKNPEDSENIKDNIKSTNAKDNIKNDNSIILSTGNALVNPKILVANTSLDYDKIKIMSSKINVNSIKELEKIEIAEKEKMKNKINKIAEKNFDLFINRQIIYDYPMQLLRNKGLAVIEHADFSGVEKLNKVLGGNLVSTFDEMKEEDFGTCKMVSVVTVKGKQLVKFDGIKKGAATILLFGSSKVMLDEAERSIHDALCVLKRIKESPYCLYGGGATEMSLAVELQKMALDIKTRESEGIEIFSRALQQIPAILANNCGFDGDEIRAALKNDHSYRRATYGVNVETGKSGCMKERGIIEGFEMKKRVITAACETAQTILKCDGIVKCKPRERQGHGQCH